jgi:hypothetical protein
LREQLGQYEELRSMRESAYREREGSPAVRFKELLYDNYVPPGVTVRHKSDLTKKPAQPAAAKGSNTARSLSELNSVQLSLIRWGKTFFECFHKRFIVLLLSISSNGNIIDVKTKCTVYLYQVMVMLLM